MGSRGVTEVGDHPASPRTSDSRAPFQRVSKAGSTPRACRRPASQPLSTRVSADPKCASMIGSVFERPHLLVPFIYKGLAIRDTVQHCIKIGEGLFYVLQVGTHVFKQQAEQTPKAGRLCCLQIITKILHGRDIYWLWKKFYNGWRYT